MLKRFIPIFLLVAAATAQVQLVQPKPVRLKVQVRYNSGNAAVQYAQVELMDAVGGSSAMDKQRTDAEGQIEFITLTGKHLLRVTGEDIEPWEGEVEIQVNERSHFEQVRVSRRKDAQMAPGPSQPVAAVRFNIPAEARKQYENGLKALQKKDWQEAKKLFEAAIASYGDYDSAYNGLGVARIGLSDTEGARTAFTHAVQLNGSYAEALRNLARIYINDKQFDKVEPLLLRSLNTEPTNSWAMINLANAYLQIKRYDEAVLWGRKAHDLPAPEDPTGHFIAACALNAQGKESEALAELENYLREDPSGPNVPRAKEMVALISPAQ